MRDLKEEYYFKTVPEIEAQNTYIDWKVYNCFLNAVLTYSALDARGAKFLAKWDLFPSAFNLLTILSRTQGEGMHLSKISELLAVSRANVTGLVDVLARKGLVNREASTADRRVRLAKLTDKGSALIQEILPKYYEFNAGLCRDLPDDDVEVMIRTLKRLRTSICADGECADSYSAEEKEVVQA